MHVFLVGSGLSTSALGGAVGGVFGVVVVIAVSVLIWRYRSKCNALLHTGKHTCLSNSSLNGFIIYFNLTSYNNIYSCFRVYKWTYNTRIMTWTILYKVTKTKQDLVLY